MSFICSNLKRCACGKPIEIHDSSVYERYQEIGPLKEKWSANIKSGCCVDDGETDAFGEISFPGANDTLSKYVRVSNHTNMDIMWELLFSKEYWNLKKPELIISVTGGATLHSLKH